MEEAGKLGTTLVQQQKELTERLREVEQLQAEGELNPELRQRLVEIEKDYNEVARESARAFLPKQRIPSNETNQGSPFALESKSGRVTRSVFSDFRHVLTILIALSESLKIREPGHGIPDQAQRPKPEVAESTIQPDTRHRVRCRDQHIADFAGPESSGSSCREG